MLIIGTQVSNRLTAGKDKHIGRNYSKSIVRWWSYRIGDEFGVCMLAKI